MSGAILKNTFGHGSSAKQNANYLRKLMNSSSVALYYDMDNISEIYQDSAGTQLSNYPGSPVGRIKNMFNSSNDLEQPISAARPTLGRHPNVVYRNLLTYSSEFSAASWADRGGISSVQTGVTSGVNGKNTASLIIENTNTNMSRNRVQGVHVVEGKYYICSMIGKSIGPQQRHLTIVFENPTAFGGYPNCILNTATGVVTLAVNGVETSAGAINLGNGYWKLWLRAKCVASGLNGFRIGFTGTDGSAWNAYNGDGVSGIAFDGAQVEIGDRVTDYQVVGSGAPLQNLITWTEDLYNTSWVKDQCTINSYTSFVDNNTSNSIHALRKVISGQPNGKYTLSFDFKKVGNMPAFTLLFRDTSTSGSSSSHINIDERYVTTGTNSFPIDTKISMIEDGWYHVQVNVNFSDSNFLPLYWDLRLSNTWPINQDTGHSYTGDGTRGLQLRKIQMVQGSIETPYQKVNSIHDSVQSVIYETTRNLIKQSSDFRKNNWWKNGSIELLEDGFLNGVPAFKLIDNSNLYSNVSQSILLKGPFTYTASIYVKKNPSATSVVTFRVHIWNGSTSTSTHCGFNLDPRNGNINTTWGAYTTGRIATWVEDKGDFYRMCFTGSIDSGLQLNDFEIFPAHFNLTGSAKGTGVNGDVLGSNTFAAPQLEFGTVATDYQHIEDSYKPWTGGPRINILDESNYTTIPQLGVMSSGTDIGSGEIHTPAGITMTLVNTSEDRYGDRYVDIRFQGSASNENIFFNFSRGNHYPATQNDRFTLSSYISLISGTLTNVTNPMLSFSERDSSNVFVTGSTTNISITNQINRFSHSATISGATTTRVIPTFSLLLNGVVDFTIRLYKPQLEYGLSPTPYQKIYGQYAITTPPLLPSKWFIRTDGVDDYIQTPSIDWNSDEVTVVALLRKRNDSPMNRLWSFATPKGFTFLGSSGSAETLGGYSNALWATTTEGRFFSPTTILVSHYAKISTDLNSFRVNEGFVGTNNGDQGTDTTYGTSPLRIGGRLIGDMYAHVDIYKLFFINRLLTLDEIEIVERIFNDKGDTIV